MTNVIDELRMIVTNYTQQFTQLSDAAFAAKPLPHKWSKQEVLGHLVDSAQNNLRRFICSQYEDTPPFIVYQQDFWVASNHYQGMPKADLIELWRLINLRICAVLETMPPENYGRACNTGSLHTLQWLAGDYVKHLKHHINQILPEAFDVVYT